MIPTIGRPELSRAVLSAHRQTGVETQIVVVVDRPEMITKVKSAVGDLAQVVGNAGQGGAAARNEGARLGSGHYIAFLDDDDWWEPNKLTVQIAAMRKADANFCFGSAWFHSGSDMRRLPITPFVSEEQTLASYMVRRPNVRFGYSLVQSSSFVVSSRIARECLWDATLRKHQDWDFALRLQEREDVRLIFVEQPLVHVAQASTGSVSKQNNLESSLRFVQRHSRGMDDEAYADFIVSIYLRAALATRDLKEISRGVSMLHARSALPRWPVLIVALSGLVSGLWLPLRNFASRLLHRRV
ncbi:glycosyltransferase family A protein [Rhodococcus sp. 15-649-2-2]|uniref:glycosyltransferase n=1 Tax=Rhodococcus sp. 15-649-2-2 TaxID=2023140 RepID=UPI0015C5C9F1